ncbi:MAG: asparagine synthase (glutamine-hydrolyzing) [Pedobacter sp.]|nr:MAG: asparagine synthase (glutamine-hydrolyzing) [Pedobacter sp.]
MCRIAGILNPSQDLIQTKQIITAMCDSMAEGGPDDEGFDINPEAGYVFGHRRLALLDLSVAGHQPMHHKDLSLVFNGEIYNFKSLREKLIEQGYEFQTGTDTEVILKGFEYWGTALFNLLEGMFAFALHHKSQGKTYLVRDEYGIKPLYYHNHASQLLFASEVKAFKSSSLNFQENPDWKTLFLSFGHIPHPYTTLKDVYSVHPGHYMIWDHATQQVQTIRYIKEKTSIKITEKAVAEKQIQQKLETAVESQLLADAPVGVFLSGGIDSSLLSLIANTKIGSQLRTLSINFAEQAYAEGRYQDIVVDLIQGKHKSYTVTESDFIQHFPEIIASMDQPSNDAINSWFVNKYAKENGLKAVLSGIGADELFGGYPSFKRIKYIKHLKKLPKFILKSFAKLKNEKLNRFYFLSLENPIGEYLFLRGFFTPNKVAEILQINLSEVVDVLEKYQPYVDLNPAYNGNRAADMETHIFMRNQLLKDTDFMSMRHGIEVRVPFLDKQLRETLAQIDPKIKFENTKPKALLVDSFINLIPEAIWNRPKMGFTFPLQKWMQNHPEITNPKTYQKNPVANEIIKDFKTGKIHWSRAYAIYQVFKS